MGDEEWVDQDLLDRLVAGLAGAPPLPVTAAAVRARGVDDQRLPNH
ncbi:MAG: hypothetical protein KKG09_10110 [Verrucomicrobia bacterium]|nr:hypothetical protein [Verrucomicrobiota bacterium]MBU4291054.1 hypothetical protein [Verrucomicrobiota bacterium]MBU4498345.1 hypothetical protein [Verrucomicrobiota bacterium]MCG2679450.1 hypothetical protein [Kiritimatiellia bacterium]MCG2819443.1 hypothetical protein [Actinomycetes bacterium]